MSSPTIGIAVDVDDQDGPRHYRLATAYAEAVLKGGGVPMLLSHAPALADTYVQRCDAVVLTGAGDAFNGGFATAIARGDDPITAVRMGCTTAGISVTRPGTALSMPVLREVMDLMEQDS